MNNLINNLENTKVIYFLGPMYSGSTYIRTILTYMTRSKRACLGYGDNYNGDGSLCGETLNLSSDNWIPDKYIKNINNFENVYISNSHFMNDLCINNPGANNIKLNNIFPNIQLKNILNNNSNIIKIQIIRNPIDSIITNFLYSNGNVKLLENSDLSFLNKYFDYYFIEKKKFEEHPIKNYYNISFKKFMNKNTQKEELINIMKILNIYDEKFLNNYIENDFDDIKNYIKETYVKIRNINDTNSNKYNYKDLLNNNQLSYLYNKVSQYIEQYNLSDKLKKDILFELE